MRCQSLAALGLRLAHCPARAAYTAPLCMLKPSPQRIRVKFRDARLWSLKLIEPLGGARCSAAGNPPVRQSSLTELTWHLSQLACPQLASAALHTLRGDLHCHLLQQCQDQNRLVVDKGREAREEA